MPQATQSSGYILITENSLPSKTSASDTGQFSIRIHSGALYDPPYSNQLRYSACNRIVCYGCTPVVRGERCSDRQAVMHIRNGLLIGLLALVAEIQLDVCSVNRIERGHYSCHCVCVCVLKKRDRWIFPDGVMELSYFMQSLYIFRNAGSLLLKINSTFVRVFKHIEETEGVLVIGQLFLSLCLSLANDLIFV